MEHSLHLNYTCNITEVLAVKLGKEININSDMGDLKHKMTLVGMHVVLHVDSEGLIITSHSVYLVRD